MVVTLFLLFREVHKAFLGGVALLVVFLIVNLAISKRIGSLTGEMMRHKVGPVRLGCALLWTPLSRLLSVWTPFMAILHVFSLFLKA